MRKFLEHQVNRGFLKILSENSSENLKKWRASEEGIIIRQLMENEKI